MSQVEGNFFWTDVNKIWMLMWVKLLLLYYFLLYYSYTTFFSRIIFKKKLYNKKVYQIKFFFLVTFFVVRSLLLNIVIELSYFYQRRPPHEANEAEAANEILKNNFFNLFICIYIPYLCIFYFSHARISNWFHWVFSCACLKKDRPTWTYLRIFSFWIETYDYVYVLTK